MKLHVFILLVLISLLAGTQTVAQKPPKKIQISGKVVDPGQNPLPGVDILIDNKNANCKTDSKGNFKLKISPGAKYITAFSMTNGMKDLPIEGKTVFNIELFAASEPIIEPKKAKEENVDVGYGTMNKKEVTTNVNKIDAQNPKFASYTSIYDLIRSEVPGVRIMGKSIFLVELSSVNESNQPLILVDGSPVASVDDVEPWMVKSIEVLKGASASMYGSRGSNGVILITLLRGTKKN